MGLGLVKHSATPTVKQMRRDSGKAKRWVIRKEILKAKQRDLWMPMDFGTERRKEKCWD